MCFFAGMPFCGKWCRICLWIAAAGNCFARRQPHHKTFAGNSKNPVVQSAKYWIVTHAVCYHCLWVFTECALIFTVSENVFRPVTVVKEKHTGVFIFFNYDLAVLVPHLVVRLLTVRGFLKSYFYAYHQSQCYQYDHQTKRTHRAGRSYDAVPIKMNVSLYINS